MAAESRRAVTSAIRIARADPREDAARELVAELDAYLNELYPPEQNYLDSPDELTKGSALFVVAWSDDRPVGCGAIKSMDGYAELKRLYVRPAARGRGVAKAIVDRLEAHARDNGFDTVRLETGFLQHESLALYARLGYRRIPCFGAYRDEPSSVFMGKTLVRV